MPNKALRRLLLFSTIIITILFIMPKPALTSPMTSVDANPTAYAITGGVSVSDPTYAYDSSLTTSANFKYDPSTAGTFEVKTFTTPSSNPIGVVDFKMNYAADAGGDGEEYRIVYYVGTAGPVVLLGWTGAAHAQATVTWANQREPNDGVWDWTDIRNIRFVVETKTGGRGGSYFDEYEAWVTVTTYSKGTMAVDPASLTGPSSPFTVDINVTGVDDLYAWEFKLYYNSTILSNNSVSEGTFLSSGGSTFFQVINNTDTYNATHGRFWVTCTLLGDVTGVSGGGTLATITLTVDGPGGTTPLDLTDTKLIGYEFTAKQLMYMVHYTTDGSVTISGVPEFPFGAALEIALVGVITYIWWRSKRKQPPKLLGNTSIPPT